MRRAIGSCLSHISVLLLLMTACGAIHARQTDPSIPAREEMDLGKQALRSDRVEEAVEHFKMAKALDPSLIDASLYLGISYVAWDDRDIDLPENQDHAELAIGEFTLVLQHQYAPQEAKLQALKNLAEIYYNQTNYAKSRQYYRQYIAEDPRLKPARFRSFPRITLWAWERPEDLREFDPRRFAICYLERTIIITDRVEVIPRKQPLALAPGATLIAAARIEAPAGTADLRDPELPAKVAGIIAESKNRRQVAAIQVDFDATKSQRSFYSNLLQQLRRKLPGNMPLSITALASWCSEDDWIGNLPIDEATPMFFRMGPEHPPATSTGWNYPIKERLCRNAAGVSTDEAWPRLYPGTRVYVFHPHAWNKIALNNVEGYLPP
jgi:tetratricopeptide (TPR) repeat protein